MTEYVHHIPGRLRVRSAAIKGSQAGAGRATTLVHSLAGVRSVEANVLTGSLTVRYDPEITSASTLMKALRDHGYLAADQKLPHGGTVYYRRPARGEFGAAVARSVARYAVEAALERSVVALVASLL